MTVASSSELVGTTAVVVIDDTSSYSVINDGRIPYGLYNAGTTSVYVGGEDVTTGTGFPVPAGASLSFELPAGSRVWAVATVENVPVRILKVG